MHGRNWSCFSGFLRGRIRTRSTVKEKALATEPAPVLHQDGPVHAEGPLRVGEGDCELAIAAWGVDLPQSESSPALKDEEARVPWRGFLQLGLGLGPLGREDHTDLVLLKALND